MGRQDYLTRLTLGRSAVSHPLSNETPSRDENTGEQSAEDSIVAYQSNHHQRYDKKGHPENLASHVRKKRWRHAVNDVLATVGVCVAERGTGSKNARVSTDSRKVEAVAFENSVGIFVSAIDWGLCFLCVYWPCALRQRLQVFPNYTQTPLVNVITGEWRDRGPLTFLLAGGTASLVFGLLDVGADWVRCKAVGFILDTIDVYIKPRKSTTRKIEKALSYCSTLIDTSVFLLILPMDMYGTLQRLALHNARPLVLHSADFFRMLKMFGRRFEGLGKQRTLSANFSTRLLYFGPLLYPWIALNYRHRIQSKVYKYIWAALPKPTSPDRNSLLGAKEDNLDFDTIPGLTDDTDPRTMDMNDNVTDQLASDLQYIGKMFQLFHDRCVALLTAIPLPRWISNGSDEIIEDTGPATQNAGQTQTTLDASSRVHTSAFRETERRVEHLERDGPSLVSNHFSPPLQSSDHSTTHPAASRPNSPSAASSTAPSDPPSPRPLTLYSNHEDGTVHVNLTINIAAQEVNGSQDPGPILATPDLGGPLSLPSLSTLQEPLIHTSNDGQSSEASEKPVSHPSDKEHHRITALTAHAADSIAHRLSFVLADILLLPFEAAYVRRVALIFLTDQRMLDHGGRVRGGIFPPGKWFGFGLGRNNWMSSGRYVGKLLLVQGLQAGLSLTVWQVGMTAVYWIGRRWCSWHKS